MLSQTLRELRTLLGHLGRGNRMATIAEQRTVVIKKDCVKEQVRPAIPRRAESLLGLSVS